MARLIVVLSFVLLFSRTSAAQTWAQVGPWASDFRWIAYNPHVPDEVFGVLSDGTLWISADNSYSWESIQPTLPEDVGPVSKVVFHPNSADTLFLLGDQLFRSADGGGSWTESDLDYKPVELIFSPHHPEIVLVDTWEHSSSLHRLYRSVDGGTSWDEVRQAEARNGFASFCWDPVDESRVLSGNVGLWESSDAGMSWNQYCDEVYGSYVHGIAILESEQDVVCVFVTGMTGYSEWVRISENGIVVEWTGIGNFNGWYGDFSGVLYGLLYNQIYRSEDGGVSWHSVFRDFPRITAFTMFPFSSACRFAPKPDDPETILLANSNGIFIGDIPTSTVQRTGTGIGFATPFEILPDPQIENGFLISAINEGVWSYNYENDAIANLHNRVAYGLTYHPDNISDLISVGLSIDDYHRTLQTVETLANPSPYVTYIDVCYDPTSQQRLIVLCDIPEFPGTGLNVLVSYDGGQRWATSLEGNLRTVAPLSGVPQSAIVGGDGLFLTLDWGEHWTCLSETMQVHKVVPSENEGVAYILTTNSADSSFYEFRFFPFQLISRSNEFAGAIPLDLSRQSGGYLLFAVSDDQLFMKRGGAPWQIIEFPGSPPYRTVSISESGNTLAVGTESDGIWVTSIENDIEDGFQRVVDKDIISIHTYPEPTNSSLVISLNGGWRSSLSISIFNILGKEVMSLNSVELRNPGASRSSVAIPPHKIDALPTGRYFLTVKDNKHVLSTRFTVLK